MAKWSCLSGVQIQITNLHGTIINRGERYKSRGPTTRHLAIIVVVGIGAELSVILKMNGDRVHVCGNYPLPDPRDPVKTFTFKGRNSPRGGRGRIDNPNRCTPRENNGSQVIRAGSGKAPLIIIERAGCDGMAGTGVWVDAPYLPGWTCSRF